MIESTLRELDSWFTDPLVDGNRSKYLCKLAVLELCGWIEGEFDRLVLSAEVGRLNDAPWCRDNVIKNIYGFHYKKHLRKMFAALFGEVGARKIEMTMERNYPGDLDRLSSLLGTLWDKRCSFAHQDFAAHIASQQRFDAPSLVLSTFTTVTELVSKFEASMHAAFDTSSNVVP